MWRPLLLLLWSPIAVQVIFVDVDMILMMEKRGRVVIRYGECEHNSVQLEQIKKT